MGLLDKPLITDQVRERRLKRLEEKERRVLLKRLGIKPDGSSIEKKEYKNGNRVRNALKQNMSKASRKEWGQRIQHLRSIV